MKYADGHLANLAHSKSDLPAAMSTAELGKELKTPVEQPSLSGAASGADEAEDGAMEGATTKRNKRKSAPGSVALRRGKDGATKKKRRASASEAAGPPSSIQACWSTTCLCTFMVTCCEIANLV